MWSPRRLTAASVVAACLAIVPVGLAAPASAEPVLNTFQIPLVTPNSIWSCGLSLFCTYPVVAITGETPGTVTFPVRSPNAHINWTYRMQWRNLGTGASGVLTIPFSRSVSVFTGSGPVTASMTTGYETIAGTGAFAVP